MSRKRKQKRDNSIVVTPTGYRVYRKGQSLGARVRDEVATAIRQSGLMGVMFMATVLHFDRCEMLTGTRRCTCKCAVVGVTPVGESPDPECNMVEFTHVAESKD
jgi:hypothetical protein